MPFGWDFPAGRPRCREAVQPFGDDRGPLRAVLIAQHGHPLAHPLGR